eukprot:CAMPEP_0206140884 /NCGR_PEP_ID=MMETSP1473-20131121/11004_1 /ASSEMBLY_ACC=CAM_ASM_001109 /TAXON_ID=1461547 /ORGANISM="Stichococcus sp, Strain RCC1054" /LENGTH=253 /DNA_ID=CAMNT_0053535217 /DNA_START=226 /DNA_END=988 /DNA_ORIENTATION=+
MAGSSDLKGKPACSEGVLNFYTHTLCPYAQRVHLTLIEKGLDFQLVHVDLSEKPLWFNALGSGLVPVVELDGIVHTESLDICRWLEDFITGEGRSALMPTDKQRRAVAEKLCSRDVGRFSGAGISFLAGTGRSWGISRQHSASQRTSFENELSSLGKLLDQYGGPYLLGESVTLADLALFPFAQRFSIACPEWCGMDMRAAAGGNIGRWLDAMQARPAVSAASPDPAKFLAAMKKHMSLDFFDYETYTAAQLF